MHRGGLRGSQEETLAAAAAIRKGPWVAEEDTVLMDYVKSHGPRDWSSIRSKGLLPRTGKSCRLRWVNKLKPGLKTGCKFSAEEERIVIELQERFGNKWARIATYLHGRTDNDVKNFWSTRQKRLARLLHTPLPTRSHRNQGNPPIVSPTESPTATATLDQNAGPSALIPYNPPCLDLIPFPEECSVNSNAVILSPEAYLRLQEPTAAIYQPPFDPRLLDFPLLPEDPYLVSEFGDLTFPNHFSCHESCPAMQLPVAPALFDHRDGSNVKIEHPETPESFFDDFPADMFECFEQPLPPPS